MDPSRDLRPQSPGTVAAELGGLRGLLIRWRAARDAGDATVLAVVTSTNGSTYRKRGAMALLNGTGLLYGALSGGCLEPELERRARAVLASSRAGRGLFDTQPDEDRVFGSGLGCRGRLETLLLPIPPGSAAHPLLALEQAFARRESLRLTLSLDEASLGAGEATAAAWRLAWDPDGHAADASAASEFRDRVSLVIPPPRALLLLGGGPETAAIIAFSRRLGFTTTAVDHRGRWAEAAREAGADEVLRLHPADAHAALAAMRFDAVLAMSHSYETDLGNLRLWLPTGVPYVGLLGPAARRDELLRDLGARAEDLAGRLHAPIGLPLGGNGPEAIALAIAAQLHQRFAAEDVRGV